MYTAKLVVTAPHRNPAEGGVWANPGAARDAHTPGPATWHLAVSPQA